MDNSLTAVLLFIRDPKEEARIKQLAGKKAYRKSTEITGYLNSHAKNLIKETGLPYFVVPSSKQIGSSFGERFANAFQSVFAKGYEKVIALGNDHPGLETNTITEAANLLSHSDAVLGPTEDGGFYLMGMDRRNFDPYIFQQFPWQTSCLRNSFIEFLEKKSSNFHILKSLKDVDSYPELLQLIKDLQLNPFFREIYTRLKAILKFSLRKISGFRPKISPSPILLPFGLRAPPFNLSYAITK